MIEMGERMGLEGTDLQAFVKEREKQALEREEREKKRRLSYKWCRRRRK